MDHTKFEGLLPIIMTTLSLFERFYVFVNGVFDVTGIVYYPVSYTHLDVYKRQVLLRAVVGRSSMRA